MYFFKFMKWFCVDYLEDGSQRFAAGAVVWLITFLITTIISTAVFGSPLGMIYYLLGTIAATLIGLFVAGILFMRRRYIEWQSLVFDKLRQPTRKDY